MEPGVPFALVAGVQLLALAAAAGIGTAALLGGVRRISVVPVVAGALVLSVAHVLTGSALGATDADYVGMLRAVAYVLLALGLGAFAETQIFPVVAPLALTGRTALLAAGGALVAAGSALRVRRGGRAALVAAFVLTAASELLAWRADTSTLAANGVLVLRGLASVAVLAFLSVLARRSVLAKVVGAVLAGLLLLAVGAAGVVGSVVERSSNRDQRELISRVAAGQRNNLQEGLPSDQLTFAQTIASCGATDALECAQRLQALPRTEPEVFFALVGRDGAVRPQQTFSRPPLDAASLIAVGQSPAVAEAVSLRACASSLDVITGARVRLVAVAAVPVGSNCTTPLRQVGELAAYGAVVGPDRVARIAALTGYDATVFVNGEVVVSSLSRRDADVVRADFADREIARVLSGGAVEEVTTFAQGARPTVHYRALTAANGEFLGVFALSAPSSVVLRTEREVLRDLFLATCLIALFAAVLGVALGRRIVAPVRSLTVAARRVSEGDLTASAEVASEDEVGELSNAFDRMTTSLAATTGDLRRSVAEESATRARLETVLESMADGLLTVDAGGKVTSVNPAAARLLGVSDSEATGRRLHQLLAGFEPAGGPGAASRRGPRSGTGVLHPPSGEPVPVAVASTPLRDSDGHVVLIRDMTREAEVDRLKTEFLSNVSHELRTPLTPIKAYAEMLARRPDLAVAQRQKAVDEIARSSDRMARVVNLLVDVASLEAGRVVAERVPLTVDSIVKARLTAWRTRAPGHVFRRRLAASLPPVLTDADWVGKALDEVIDNAVKYSPAGSVVTLSAALREGDSGVVRLTVRDQGPGVDPETLPTLFSDFRQADASATRAVGGLGLGLSFVRRVGEAFGFGVYVDPAPGTGAAFSLDLPAAPKPRRPAKRAR